MVEKGASERFDEIVIEGRDSIRRKDLQKYIRSNFERVNLGKRKKSKIKVVYMNYRTPGGRIRGNPLKQNQRFQNKFQVAELVKSGQQCQKQKRNPCEEGGRYHPCNRRAKNHHIFFKKWSQFCGKNSRLSKKKPIVNFKERKMLKIDKLIQNFQQQK